MAGARHRVTRIGGAILMALGMIAVTLGITTVPASAGKPGSIDFAAANPATYDHKNLTPTADFGYGGGANPNVVESLQGSDFDCGDQVVFFTHITGKASQVVGGAASLTYRFTRETTGHKNGTPAIGFREFVSVGLHKTEADLAVHADAGNDGTATTTGALVQGSELVVPVAVTGADTNDVFIVQVVVRIVCEAGLQAKDNTGNLQARLALAGAGDQTIPLRSAAGAIVVTPAAFVTVVKDAQSDDAQDFTFQGLGAAITLDDDGTLVTPSATPNSETVQVAPNAYTLSEDAVTGWSVTSISCVETGTQTPFAGAGTPNLTTRSVALTLADGDDVTCTFVNQPVVVPPQPASVTVVKDAQPDDAQDFVFQGLGSAITLDDDGTLPAPSATPSSQTVQVAAGNYTLSEDAVAGWSVTSISCVVTGTQTPFAGAGAPNLVSRSVALTLAAGDAVTCTFGNQPVVVPPLPATLTIVEDADPDDPQDFSFTAGAGLAPSSFTLDDDGTLGAPSATPNSQQFTNLAAGAYVVTQGALAQGWSLASIVCTGATSFTPTGSQLSVTLAAGQNAVCTFRNTFTAGGGGGGGGGGGTPPAPAATGSLTVSKTVVNGEGDERFDFGVVCGGVTTILTLGHGDTSTVGDIPLGTTCTVVEQEPVDTESVTWTTTVTDSDGAADGVVVVDGAETVAFTNSRTVVQPAVVERPAPVAQPGPIAAPVTEPAVLPATASRELARTGATTGSLMLFAGVALLLGGALVVGSERLRPAPARRRI